MLSDNDSSVKRTTPDDGGAPIDTNWLGSHQVIKVAGWEIPELNGQLNMLNGKCHKLNEDFSSHAWWPWKLTWVADGEL